MKFWTQTETEDWLAENGLASEENSPATDGSWTSTTLELPTTSLEQASLARSVISQADFNQGGILSLTERTLCKEDEEPILIERLRLSHGESRTLLEAPTFVFEANEEVEAAAILRLFIMFCWDGYLVNAQSTFCFRLWGHEGEASIETRNSAAPRGKPST